MKYIHIGVSLLIGLSAYSCRTAKERSERVQRDLTSESQESFIAWQYADSAGRYWHFQSDSLLFYHPDYGLYGMGGRLVLAEGEVKQEQEEGIISRSAYAKSTLSEEDYTAKPVRGTKHLWVFVLTVIVVVSSWIWKGLLGRKR